MDTSSISILINNDAQVDFYCRAGSSVLEDLSSRREANLALRNTISSIGETKNVKYELNRVVGEYLHKQGFTYIPSGVTHSVDKPETSWTTCIHVSPVDDNKVRVETLLMDPSTKYDMQYQYKTYGSVETNYAMLKKPSAAPALASPRLSISGRFMNIINNSPKTWYCDIRSSDAALANEKSAADDLVSIIESIDPTQNVTEQVANEAHVYLQGKRNFRKIAPKEGKVWIRHQKEASLGTCVNAEVVDTMNTDVHIKTLAMPGMRNINFLNTWLNNQENVKEVKVTLLKSTPTAKQSLSKASVAPFQHMQTQLEETTPPEDSDKPAQISQPPQDVGQPLGGVETTRTSHLDKSTPTLRRGHAVSVLEQQLQQAEAMPATRRQRVEEANQPERTEKFAPISRQQQGVDEA